jgi:threonine dehydratase
VFAGVQVRDRAETRRLVRRLRSRGLKTLDFTDNELAKLHIRHTVGGHAPGLDNEILYRFEFPERPGALMNFLTAMSGSWNISLFHYRNHGADYGRVLVGMQVPPQDMQRFRSFLARVGYPCHEESRNAAYRLFLA